MLNDLLKVQAATQWSNVPRLAQQRCRPRGSGPADADV